MEFAKVIEGVELSDVESESLATQKADLIAKLAQLAAALESANASLVATDAALAARSELSSVEDRARDIAERLADCGCTDAAIRAAIVAQFGKKAPVAVKHAKSPSAGGTKEKPISTGLPSEVDADSILSAVRTAGAEGIQMETLYDTFPAVCPNGAAATDSEKSRAAVFATVKNALLAKRVTTAGQARGMRYFWATEPVAAVEPPPAQ